jgi:hypothetical protein
MSVAKSVDYRSAREVLADRKREIFAKGEGTGQTMR